MKAGSNRPAEHCMGSGNHKGWKRGFLFTGGAWRCRACRDVTHA